MSLLPNYECDVKGCTNTFVREHRQYSKLVDVFNDEHLICAECSERAMVRHA